MEETTNRSRGSRKAAEPAASETTDAAATEALTTGPQEVQMHRAVYELVTGTEPEDKIDGGTIITDEIAAAHDLDDKQLEALLDAGAVELVDVLVR